MSCGLAGDFARFVGVLSADIKLMFKDSYKGKIDHKKVTMKKDELMERMKKYEFIKKNGNIYEIYKVLPSTGDGYRRIIK